MLLVWERHLLIKEISLEISFSRESSWPRNQTQVSCISGRCFNLWATREAQRYIMENYFDWGKENFDKDLQNKSTILQIKNIYRMLYLSNNLESRSILSFKNETSELQYLVFFWWGVLCECMLRFVQLSVTPWTAAHWLFCPWDFSGKIIGVGCRFLLQRIFKTQRLNQWHLIGRRILFHWATWEAPGSVTFYY